MNFLIVGAGRMGRRHIRALVEYVPELELTVCDKQPQVSKEIQKEYTSDISKRIRFSTLESLRKEDNVFDGAVIATSAFERLELIKDVLNLGVRNLLIEKPVEQSIKRFDKMVALLEQHDAQAYVNFIKRVSPGYLEIDHLFRKSPQFQGKKNVMISGGASGIGCNGIHFIDTAIGFLDAVDYRIKLAEIDDTLIASGRGDHYRDFGGSAVIDLLDINRELSGTLLISLSAESSIPYSISILGRHARIDIDDNEDKYSYTMREEGSQLPVYRCYSDYSKWNVKKLRLLNGVGKLGVNEWMKSCQGNKIRLPELKASRLAHQIMFEWLGHSDKFDDVFPIT